MLTDKQKEIIDIVTGMVEEHFADEYSGHDFLHTKRVVRNAYELSESEGGDLFVIILAALVHDVDDKKLDVDRKGEFYYGRKNGGRVAARGIVLSTQKRVSRTE